MGIPLTQLVSGEEIGFDELFDKKIAIDAYNWIYQFLSIIRQLDGTPLKDSKGRITSHLSGLYYRSLKLLESGIKPVYVFDGKPPDMKKKVTQERRDIRAEAARAWQEALEKEDFEAAKKHAQRAATIDDEIVDSSKQLLEAMGIPWMQAPNEGEALCSVMCKKNLVYAVSSQDYDVLLFGSPRLVRNLSISGKKKRGKDYVIVNPEIILLKDVLNKLGINQDQLIMLGILVGTDYNSGGVAGYGPKRALALVKEKKTFDRIFKDLIWDFSVSPSEIFDFFKNPKEIKVEIKFRELDEEKVKHVLVDNYEFSEERIDSALRKLKEKKGEQSSLSRWV